MTTEDKTKLHDSDCALHNMPAYPNGECNCSLFSKTTTEKAAIKLRTLANQLDTTIGQSEFFFALAENIEAKEKLIRAQEARIAALTKDAERLKCFNQIWRWKALKDGEIIYQYGEHVPALFQKTAELLPTHPPAPDYTDLLKMIAHRARSFPNFPLGHHITEVFAAIGEEPPEPAPAPAPELKPLSLDEIHQRYKNLRGNEPPHYIDIYRDAEAALGILRGGL
jgi:hypothetical protein